MAGPILTVGMPVFNGEQYLRPAMDCLLSQSLADFELLIADNASTDATAAICREYAAREPRIRYVRNESNIGAAANFNLVANMAGTKYFKWAAHDDICDSRFLQLCVEELEKDSQAVLCYSRSAQIDQDGKILDQYDCPMNTNSQWPSDRFRDLIWVDHPCTAVFGVFRLEVLKRTPLMGSYVGADRNLLAEMGLRGPFREIPQCLFFQRLHPHQSIRLQERERAAWFDPHLAGRITFPAWRPIIEYASSVSRVPLRAFERLRCFHSIAGLTFRRRSRLAADVRYAISCCTRGVKHRQDYVSRWQRDLRAAQSQIEKIIPASAAFVLVDEDSWGSGGWVAGRRALPFVERQGCYWGPPPDDQRSVEELERMRSCGASHIAFAWPAFWWLEYYSDLASHLRRNYRRVLKSRQLVIFDLRA